jgi:hypothetical protein
MSLPVPAGYGPSSDRVKLSQFDSQTAEFIELCDKWDHIQLME